MPPEFSINSGRLQDGFLVYLRDLRGLRKRELKHALVHENVRLARFGLSSAIPSSQCHGDLTSIGKDSSCWAHHDGRSILHSGEGGVGAHPDLSLRFRASRGFFEVAELELGWHYPEPLWVCGSSTSWHWLRHGSGRVR